MAPATSNVASYGACTGTLNGNEVPHPSDTDTTNPQGSPLPRSTPGEFPEYGTLHDEDLESTSSLPAPLPPDFAAEIDALRTAAVQDVIHQVLNNSISGIVSARMNRYAEKNNLAFTDVVRMVADHPAAAAPIFADDPMKQRFHERRSLEYVRELTAHANSPVYDLADLPTRGPNAMYLTTQGVRHGDELGRLKRRASSCDANSLVLNPRLGPWSLYHFHKYTQDEGGSQERAFDDVIRFAESARTYSFVEGPAHRTMDPTGARYTAVYLAVLDGPFWTASRINDVKRAGRASDQITPGGFYVTSTQGLAEFFTAVAAA